MKMEFGIQVSDVLVAVYLKCDENIMLTYPRIILKKLTTLT